MPEDKLTWDQYFINLCYEIAKKSKDPSTKVGCIIVYQDNGICTTGFNGFARGIEDSFERLENRSIKYPMIVHSETNAIYNAAKHGHNTNGCKMYVPWLPCSSCANSIVQSGIVEVIMDGNFVKDPDLMKRWEKEHNMARTILEEGGVVMRKHTLKFFIENGNSKLDFCF